MRWLRWSCLLMLGALLAAQQQQSRPRVVLKGGVQENHRRIEGGGGSSMKPENGGCPPATNGWVLVYHSEGDCRYWHAWPARGQNLPPITPDGRGGGGRCQFCPAPWNDADDPPERPFVYVPGGYDPCQNPRPPANCAERQHLPPQPSSSQFPAPPEQPTPAPSNYFRDRAERTEGFKQGLRDCVQELLATPGALLHFGYDIVCAAATFGQGDLEGAAAQLGIKQLPAQLQQEFDPNRIGISAHEQGRLMARRLCLYGVVPMFAKGVKVAVKAAKGPGATALNPMTGDDIRRRLGSVGQPPDGRTIGELEHSWVRLGNGPVKLGKQLGGGDFATVYEVVEGARGGQVVKFARAGGEEALQGQVDGFRNLKTYAPHVPTPEVRSINLGNREIPAHVMIDDVNKAFKLHDAPPGVYEAPESRAIQELHWDLGRADLLAPDLHPMNIFLIKEGGGRLRAGVLDTDMIHKSAMRLSSGNFPQKALFQWKWQEAERLLRGRGLEMPAGAAAPGWMEMMYTLHYTSIGIRRP
jgi:hypothetical protein